MFCLAQMIGHWPGPLFTRAIFHEITVKDDYTYIRNVYKYKYKYIYIYINKCIYIYLYIHW